MTPSSVIFRRPDRENTWNPPESVRMGPSQSINLWRPPISFTTAVTRTEVEVVGVGQLDLAAHILQVVGRHRTLDGALGAHVHENRGSGLCRGHR